MAKQQPNIILGCASFGSPEDPTTKTHTSAQAEVLFNVLTSYGHSTIDTSRRYPPTRPGTSEEVIGATLSSTETASNIVIDTKVLSAPGCHKPENIAKSIADSLNALGVSSVHTIYLHFPDRTQPLTNPVSALSHAVSTGQAKQWGISNYTLADVQEILSLCKQHDWIPPAVFQGEYNPLNREAESELIPYLHEHGVAFYAYSPGAGGAIAPTGSRLTAKGPAGDRVRQLYGGEKMQGAIQKVRDAVDTAGLKGHEAAIRWTVWDGVLDGKYGDGVIVGASSEGQLRETLEAVKRGGLSTDVRDVVGGIWGDIQNSRAEKAQG
ncbi:NADP-dependent oxidoreductase domain-containing protein [Exophiala viscosa]|uniref:NADP-dependent oxidoreductase domain-containing protein n=1 Tax=Exophiala viscosa TaxID=2486360 RepID=A0AAN6IAP5_9EURO|nr:NADP-dependent oxidoreductase domain-containing protein [Exophiala viscosa]